MLAQRVFAQTRLQEAALRLQMEQLEVAKAEKLLCKAELEVGMARLSARRQRKPQSQPCQAGEGLQPKSTKGMCYSIPMNEAWTQRCVIGTRSVVIPGGTLAVHLD